MDKVQRFLDKVETVTLTVEQAAEYCKEYNFSPNRNYRNLGLLLIDTEFFERKVLNIKTGKKVFYKKIQ